VSGFEPDPTSIVSPSSFVALPLGAFLRQAALLSVNTYSGIFQPPRTNFTNINLSKN